MSGTSGGRPMPSTKRVPTSAIAGGGISGLAAAYELARQGAAFTLFEASGRFGGIVETRRARGFVIECGPDSWVTEKPWARELAVELGLEDQILPSNDQWRRTYLFKEHKGSRRLVPIPDGMRMMTPVKWGPLLTSPLFSWRAKLAYLREPGRAEALKGSSPKDEPVGEFVRRHFGAEVARTVAGPLLAGVFGGDIETLSARAVMGAFVKMEAEQGSLIRALRQRAGKSEAPQAIFTTLASGMETVIDRMVESLPAESLHLDQPVTALSFDGGLWRLTTAGGEHGFDSVILATPSHVTRNLLAALGDEGRRMADLLPQHSTSAIIVALAFDAAGARVLRIPRGFGFLVPPPVAGQPALANERELLACTFADQKFSQRAPSGGVLLRAFFGGGAAEALLGESDEAIALRAREQLARILESNLESGRRRALPEPVETVVRRWPLSLPQYTVGHLERMAELESLVAQWPGLSLTGNAFHGVGVSDLVREGRAAARAVLQPKQSARGSQR